MSKDPTDIQRRAIELDAAYRAGDLETVRRLLGDPPGFPNCPQPFELGCAGAPLDYAFCWSPAAMIYALLALGADVNYDAGDGFPALFTLLETDRADKYELLAHLLDHGADIHRRGINDWTPLHYAAAQRDLRAVEILLSRGADPHLKTRIDEGLSALEEAERNGYHEIAAAMMASAS
ncbi:ankyrin repeat domain-containing protein [Sneathiella chungangensis]|uniref:Ankyrin repeat domain-containing protein n=1 Tax=Sneathiella chungangensis TaxID=1418234 RepID=A0A845MKL1_9PROT|nr:ankyrin repeat domain-containing protein [Sneathiella chungangensis]MZR24155.1 ankyrin repeat domain-containing protein [Sneathiella chungangensis]